MKLGIVGSREFSGYSKLKAVVDTFLYMGIDCIVSGGAVGADSLGEQYAMDNNLKFICHLPAHKIKSKNSYHPSNYHPSNFFARNTLIAKDSDMVIGFVNDVKSNGTWDTLSKAARMGKQVYVYWSSVDRIEAFKNQDSPMSDWI